VTPMDHAYVEAHDVLDAYLKDALSEDDRNAFEAHYFDCATCLERLETASDFREGMLQVATEDAARARTGLVAALALLSRGRRIALGVLLLLLVALPLGLLAARNRGLERQLAEARSVREEAPGGAGGERIANLEARLKSVQETGAANLQRLEAELAKERQARTAGADDGTSSPRFNVPLFTLAAVRGGEEEGREPVNRLPLSATNGPVILTLELATVDYPSYGASLRTMDSREVWQAHGLRPDSRDTLVLLLPSRMLHPGSYQLAITGARSDGKEAAAGLYPFQVTRRPAE